MTRVELESLMERHVAAFNQHDPAALAAQHTVDGVVESPMFATLRGRTAIEESHRLFLSSFPDAAITLDTLVIDPPRVAIFLMLRATHVGDFFGIAGTNRHFDVPMARIVTMEDGLIGHERRIYDFTGLLVQIGVLRAKPAKP
jgi:predicted ester cyclase